MLHVWCELAKEYCYLPIQHSTCNASYASYKVFPWNKLRVLPSDVAAGEISSDFDLLFISIHAFKDLMDNNDDQLCHLSVEYVKNIFIDEYHNIFSELFCHTNSLVSLRYLATHDIKITLLSATANTILMSFVRHYLGLEATIKLFIIQFQTWSLMSNVIVISYLMLTSDCLQSKKEDTMLAWEERNEQYMVSTIVDGIDNGAVGDVIVYRASYSLI